MTYIPEEKRYDGALFNRCGRSGIVLPPISLGLWQNFGGVNVFETGRAVIRRAFDRGVLPQSIQRWSRVRRCGEDSSGLSLERVRESTTTESRTRSCTC